MHHFPMLTRIYIEALLADEKLIDQVWAAWDQGEIGTYWAAWGWCILIATRLRIGDERI
jgi:hypothetical protein